MFEYLALTNGTTILDLTDNIDYALVSYAPVIAPLNDNELGPVWADVQETITFHARGCTAADAYDAVQAVNALLDQARRWQQGENVSAVVLLALPQGSSRTAPLRAIVRGRAPGGPSNVALPATYNAQMDRYVIQNVTTQFVRAGQWIDSTAETTTITAAANNPTVQTANFASTLTISSPTTLTCSFTVAAAAATALATAPTFTLWANNTSRLQIYEAESGSLGANLASTADAANKARGGSVARYSPGALSTSLTVNLSSFDSTSRRVAIWAAVRNNSATTTWTIRASTSLSATSFATGSGPIVSIDVSSTQPRLVFLGIISTRLAVEAIILVLTASAASGTLDIDYFCIQAIDDESSGAVAMYDNGRPMGESPLVTNPQALAQPTPTVVGGNYHMNYAGDAYVLTKGQSYAAVWLATRLQYWRAVDNGANLIDTQFTGSRLNAYLSPR